MRWKVRRLRKARQGQSGFGMLSIDKGDRCRSAFRSERGLPKQCQELMMTSVF